MKNRLRSAGITCALGLAACVLPAYANPTNATAYAVFGGQDVVANGTINGLVGSNANIYAATFSVFNGDLYGGGYLLGSGDYTVNGKVTFNGDVTPGGGATITGPVNSGGNVDTGFAGTTTGSIFATGNVHQRQSGTVNGDVHAGGSFQNDAFAKVNGSVFANTSASIGGSVSGNVTAPSITGSGSVTGLKLPGTTPVTPEVFTPVSLPAATTFTSGGADISTGNTLNAPLAPGSYGSLNIPALQNLYLTAGDYYFDSVDFTGGSINILNLTPSNQLHIYVTGDVLEGTFATMTINGQSFANADPTLAANVLIETHGNYFQSPPGLGSVDVFGTIFAPNGNITIGNFSHLTGSLIASGTVTMGSLTANAPEPASLTLLLPAAWLLAGKRPAR